MQIERKKKKVSAVGKPFVSVCTPTYNRRQFIPQLIECFKQQNYPKELMEWIIVDDGDDSVEDLFKDVECVKYFREEKKINNQTNPPELIVEFFEEQQNIKYITCYSNDGGKWKVSNLNFDNNFY